ncbi:MAG: acyltransferase [Bacteroidales bacterium]|nr:acyltransferase [Bacteroidales bacterium]
MSVKGSICFGSGVILDQGCILSVSKGAEIIFGSNIYVNRCTKIHAKESIRIGDNCRIGWNCQIFDTNFHYSIINGRINNKNSAVVLEHNVWLANGVTVGKGVKLPPFSVVASNSLVNKDYCDKGEGWLFGGVPAKPIISCIKRILDKEKVLDSYFEDGKDFVMYDEVKSVLGGQ